MSAKRITEERCQELYKQYNTPLHVIGHCKAVTAVAETIGTELNKFGYDFDIDLIRGAGLVHDVARTQEEHWKVGADILEELGYIDEADIVRVHMFYEFNDIKNLCETDMVCLGDRLVKENKYVGLDERIQYLIDKVKDSPERVERILLKKEETKKLIIEIEGIIGKSIDNLMMKG